MLLCYFMFYAISIGNNIRTAFFLEVCTITTTKSNEYIGEAVEITQIDLEDCLCFIFSFDSEISVTCVLLV